jgi:hypothetical protein
MHETGRRDEERRGVLPFALGVSALTALDRWKSRAEKAQSNRERNRELMPICTAFIDEMREVFGDGIKVKYANENGIVLGELTVIGFPDAFKK